MLELIQKFGNYSGVALAMGIIGILMVLLFPIPTPLLDVLLALSLAISLIILMTTLFISKPLELSVFPTILLVTTLLRLALNIASTRLVLSNGHNGTAAAGHIIEAFGSFVMQGNVVIGIIVFLILTLINFIVITKGSGRIAEVAARFSLDAMPGKQLAIDSDLSSGLITEEVAKARRKELENETTFFGSMDGANKFVRGDAIAGLVITFINFVGGMVIGMVQRDMPFAKAVHTYTMLTIGDGLISQMPSLIISLAAGLLVTKSGVVGPAARSIVEQFSRYPQSLGLAAIVTALMALLPGLPFTPFMLLAIICGSLAYAVQNVPVVQKAAMATSYDSGVVSDTAASVTGAASKAEEADSANSLSMDAISLELGYGLLILLNSEHGHRLSEQIKALRRQMIKDYGFVMPSVRVRDNMHLPHNGYIIKVKELEASRGEVMPDKLLIMDPKGELLAVEGIDTKEPTFGLSARWIDPKFKDDAIYNNYTVVDPSTVITTHLTEIVKENITELLSYTEVQKMLDDIADEHKKLIKDVVPDIVSVATLQKVLHNLLAESISIRDLPSILEATAEAVRSTKSLVMITEIVRLRLSRQICHAYTNFEGYIPVVSLSQDWDNLFVNSLVAEGEEKRLIMPPSKIHEFINKIKKIYDDQAAKGHIPILMTSSMVRPYVRSVLERFRPSTAVMSQNEIHFKAKIRTLGFV